MIVDLGHVVEALAVPAEVDELVRLAVGRVGVQSVQFGDEVRPALGSLFNETEGLVELAEMCDRQRPRRVPRMHEGRGELTEASALM